MNSHARRLLAFIAGGERWLLDPGRSVQVIDAAVTPVPLTRPWYLGLVRRRQRLFGVIDLGGLAGRAVPPLKPEERLLVLPEVCGAALRVDCVQGLLDAAGLMAAALPEPCPWPWVVAARDDAHGQRWQVLDIGQLCSAPVFLQAGISRSA